MAGCVPCFILPLLLFIFHRYIQPIILKFWNPWEKIDDTAAKAPFNCTSCKKNEDGKEKCELKDKEESSKLKTN